MILSSTSPSNLLSFSSSSLASSTSFCSSPLRQVDGSHAHCRWVPRTASALPQNHHRTHTASWTVSSCKPCSCVDTVLEPVDDLDRNAPPTQRLFGSPFHCSDNHHDSPLRRQLRYSSAKKRDVDKKITQSLVLLWSLKTLI